MKTVIKKNIDKKFQKEIDLVASQLAWILIEQAQAKRLSIQMENKYETNNK